MKPHYHTHTRRPKPKPNALPVGLPMERSATVPKKVESGNNYVHCHWRRADGHRKVWYRVLPLFLPTRTTRTGKKMKVVIRSYKKRNYDNDNFILGCKPILDYLKHAGYLYDDSTDWLVCEYEQHLHAGDPYTTIAVTIA